LSHSKSSELRGIPDTEILHKRVLSDGTKIYKVAGRKGKGDFRVIVVHPKSGRLTPSHAHFAIDLFGKLCADPDKTVELFTAIEAVFRGSSADAVLERLKREGRLNDLSSLPAYSVEHVIYALEAIFEQENVNWDRGMAGRPLPKVRTQWIRQGFITDEEAKKGSAIAIVLLRRVVKDRIHPASALPEVGLRIVPSR
jgi:hypothetical protein